VDNRAENKHINSNLMSRLFAVMLLFAATCGLQAQDEEAVAVAAIGLTTRQVFRGVEQAGAGGQGTFQIARNGWRFGGELSQPFDRDETGAATLHAAYGWKATDQLKLEAIITQHWYSEVAPGTTKRSFEVGLTAGWDLPNGFAVELAGFNDVRLKASTLQATVNYSMPLKALGAYLEWSASIGSSSARNLLPDAGGSPVRDNYTYFLASVRLPYRVGPHTTVTAGLHCSESDGQSRFWSPSLARGGARAWVDLGLSYDF